MPKPGFYALSSMLCLLLLVGCGRERDTAAAGPVFQPTSGSPALVSERDSILVYLHGIDQTDFRQAFSRLSGKRYTRYTRTEQFDSEDFLIAFEERILRHGGPPDGRRITTVAADSAGAFDYGYFSRFVSETVDTRDPGDLAQHVVPDDPAYLSPRNRQAYTYRFLSDTLMWDMTAHVVEIRARPEDGDGQNVRRVRLYVERGTDRLIAIYLERIDLAMWFREESRFYVHVRPSPSGGWVPYNTRFETSIRVPFRAAQRFRTVSTYYDFEAAS